MQKKKINVLVVCKNLKNLRNIVKMTYDMYFDEFAYFSAGQNYLVIEDEESINNMQFTTNTDDCFTDPYVVKEYDLVIDDLGFLSMWLLKPIDMNYFTSDILDSMVSEWK